MTLTGVKYTLRCDCCQYTIDRENDIRPGDWREIHQPHATESQHACPKCWKAYETIKRLLDGELHIE